MNAGTLTYRQWLQAWQACHRDEPCACLFSWGPCEEFIMDGPAAANPYRRCERCGVQEVDHVSREGQVRQ